METGADTLTVAAVDHDEGDLPVFESGAVMVYLAEKYGKFLPTDRRQKAEVISWLMFQMVRFLHLQQAPFSPILFNHCIATLQTQHGYQHAELCITTSLVSSVVL